MSIGHCKSRWHARPYRHAERDVCRSSSAFGAARQAALHICLILWIFVVLVGCGGAQRAPGTTSLRVQSVTFEGVEAFNPIDIAEVLETRSSLQPNLRRPRLNPYVVATDIQRIETYYRSRGFLQARVVNYSFGEDESNNTARVHFVVEEGEPSTVRVFEYVSPRLGQMDLGTLTEDITLGRGTRFDDNALQAARDLIRRRLTEASYAYARVDARVYADRATNSVEVFVFIESGVSCVFGDVTVMGNRQIPSDRIIQRLSFEEGDNYKESRLRLSQLNLYEMGAFNFVSIDPVLSDARAQLWRRWGSPGNEAQASRAAHFDAMEAHDRAMADRGLDLLAVSSDWPGDRSADHRLAGLLDNLDAIQEVDNAVPITVTVSENPGATYRVGGGLGIMAGRSETYARGRATYRNALAPLNQIDLDGRLGYAWLPSVFSSEQTIDGIIGKAQVGFSRPGLFNFADLQTRVSYERNLQDDYAFRRPSLTVGFSRRLSQYLTAQAGFSVDIMLTNDDLLPTAGSCQAVPDTFRLSRFDTSVSYDRRDNPLAARSGWFSELGVQVGIRSPLGDFSYLRVLPDVRIYQPIGRRLTAAVRVSGGAIIDFGDNVPRSQCLYLGGGDTIRGFPQRRLSPYDGSSAVGGLTMYMFNIEPRIELARDWLFGVIFLDGGSVSSGEMAFNFRPGEAEGLQLAAGAGVRVVTPVGPFRLDVGYRLTSAPQYDQYLNSRLAFFLSIGEAF